jgi:hypothetical protein
MIASESYAMLDKILVEIIAEHLPYEIDMLRLSYDELEARAKKLTDTNKSKEEQVRQYALIEGFCVHARSLIDFFSNRRTQKTDAIASDFTTGFVTTLDLAREPLKSIRVKLNKQIFHLTTDRTIIDAKKFDVGTDGTTLRELLEPETEKFTAALKPEFKPLKCATARVTTLVAQPFSSCTAIIQ